MNAVYILVEVSYDFFRFENVIGVFTSFSEIPFEGDLPIVEYEESLKMFDYKDEKHLYYRLVKTNKIFN